MEIANYYLNRNNELLNRESKLSNRDILNLIVITNYYSRKRMANSR